MTPRIARLLRAGVCLPVAEAMDREITEHEMRTIVCPSCGGCAKVYAHINVWGGQNVWDWVSCDRCNGRGLITEDQQRATELGEQVRAIRKGPPYYTLREFAAQHNLNHIELSQAENGRLAPERAAEILEIVRGGGADGN